MRSRSHRANLLSPRYDAIDIAILYADDLWYVTQDFAHTTSEATVAEAERTFEDAVAALRKSHRLPPVEVEIASDFRGAACEMARRDDLDRITVGTCRRETPSYPSGVFWFAVAY